MYAASHYFDQQQFYKSNGKIKFSKREKNQEYLSFTIEFS